MMQTVSNAALRVLFWLATAVFTVSLLAVGSVVLLAGGLWMLLTGRKPVIAYRQYQDLRRRAEERWAPGNTATEERVRRHVPRTQGHDVQDVEVKDIRTAG